MSDHCVQRLLERRHVQTLPTAQQYRLVPMMSGRHLLLKEPRLDWQERHRAACDFRVLNGSIINCLGYFRHEGQFLARQDLSRRESPSSRSHTRYDLQAQNRVSAELE